MCGQKCGPPSFEHTLLETKLGCPQPRLTSQQNALTLAADPCQLDLCFSRVGPRVEPNPSAGQPYADNLLGGSGGLGQQANHHYNRCSNSIYPH